VYGGIYLRSLEDKKMILLKKRVSKHG